MIPFLGDDTKARSKCIKDSFVKILIFIFSSFSSNANQAHTHIYPSHSRRNTPIMKFTTLVAALLAPIAVLASTAVDSTHLEAKGKAEGLISIFAAKKGQLYV